MLWVEILRFCLKITLGNRAAAAHKRRPVWKVKWQRRREAAQCRVALHKYSALCKSALTHSSFYVSHRTGFKVGLPSLKQQGSKNDKY